MSPHLKAYAVVMMVSIAALLFFRRPFRDLLGNKRLNNWSVTWLAVTSCVFLLTNYWLFVVFTAGVLFVLSRSEPIKPAIYLLLLCVAPKIGEAIPGFAGINKFIEVNPQLVTAFVVLLPALFVSRHMKKLNKVGGAADIFFLLFLLLQLILAVRAPSFTHMLRVGIQEFLFLAPIYYVFSRYPKSFEDIRVLSAAFVFPVLILSAMSIPEFVKSWHFYHSVAINWFGPMPFGYSIREGYLRATASTYNPIVWGFVAMSAIGIALAVLNDSMPRLYRYAGFALLGIGLVFSLSRGPWIGAAAIVFFYVLLSPKMITRAFQVGTVGIVAGALSLLTPFGQSIIGLIPFFGAGDDATINYRRELLDTAWDVILYNPLFGSTDFFEHSALQSMRQGQGIIDIVNTYLQIGLKNGLVGLGLFLAFFTSVILALLKAHKITKDANPLLANYCRAYLATILGVLVTIFTTSSEEQISNLYWIFGGLGIAISRVAAASAVTNKGASPV